METHYVYEYFDDFIQNTTASLSGGGSEIRLLQFADDVAIIARSAADLEQLLACFEKYSDVMSLIKSHL